MTLTFKVIMLILWPVTMTSDGGRWCCHQKEGAFWPPVTFLGIEEWWSLEKFPSNGLSTVLRYKGQVSSYSAYGDMERPRGLREGSFGLERPSASSQGQGRGRADTQYRGPMPTQCLKVGGKPRACAGQMREWRVQPAKPLSAPNMVTQGQDRSLMLWACDFAGNHIWLWEGRWIQLASEPNSRHGHSRSLSTEVSSYTVMLGFMAGGLFLPRTQEPCIPWRVCPALNL